MKLRGLSKCDQTSLTQPIDQRFSPNDNSTGGTEEERLGRANSCSSQTLLVLTRFKGKSDSRHSLYIHSKKNPDHDI